MRDSPASLSAATLLASLASVASHRFSSNCPALDSLLTPACHDDDDDDDADGKEEHEAGLARGAILELVGPAGIGKSRTAMAFALAEAFKPDGGHVLIIDCEGSLNPRLLYETAAVFAKHNGYDGEQLSACAQSLLYRRIDSAWLLVAFFNTLPLWLEEHPEVNLVIIDSLSAHLRPTLDLQTKKLLTDLIRATLSSICATRHVAFLVTTKMTIKLFGTDNRATSWSRDAEAMMVPTVPSNEWLPSSSGHAHAGVWKVLLYFDHEGERLARLLEAPVETKSRDVAFTMDASGPYDHQVPPGSGCEEG
ncbi:hypothetical protein JCM11491_006106 [Sporobolomyces phaffii]